MTITNDSIEQRSRTVRAMMMRFEPERRCVAAMIKRGLIRPCDHVGWKREVTKGRTYCRRCGTFPGRPLSESWEYNPLFLR